MDGYDCVARRWLGWFVGRYPDSVICEPGLMICVYSLFAARTPTNPGSSSHIATSAVKSVAQIGGIEERCGARGNGVGVSGWKRA